MAAVERLGRFLHHSIFFQNDLAEKLNKRRNIKNGASTDLRWSRKKEKTTTCASKIRCRLCAKHLSEQKLLIRNAAETGRVETVVVDYL